MEIILLIVFLLLNSVAIFGFNVATDFDWVDEDHKQLGVVEHSKMILWKVRYWSLKYLGNFWSKPVCLCPPCMSSLHSTYFYLFFLSLVHFQLQWILFYPMYVLILCGLNYIISLNLPKH